jgi:hypothetical protein
MGTFGWVFSNEESQSSWSSFVEFLENEDVMRPYWIRGKAGSGKSTLMKFLVSDPRTKFTLKIWKGEQKLFTAPLFL